MLKSLLFGNVGGHTGIPPTLVDVKFEPSEPEPRDEEGENRHGLCAADDPSLNAGRRDAALSGGGGKKRRRGDDDHIGGTGDVSIKRELMAAAHPEESAAANDGFFPVLMAGQAEEGDGLGGSYGQCQETEDSYDEGWNYVQEMISTNAEEAKERQEARERNSLPREDCPICGDRVNGIHYGIYTCEGCKNFFKRSMAIKKPYVCNLEGQCDVNIVIDMSGIKRKGARCQACRFKMCIESGMVHQGYNRNSTRTPKATTAKKPAVHHGPAAVTPAAATQQPAATPAAPLQLAAKKFRSLQPRSSPNNGNGGDTTNAISFQGNDNHLPSFLCDVPPSISITTVTEPAAKPPCPPGGAGGFHSLNGSDYLFTTSQEVVENVFKADLEYEREKRKELERRLEAKDNQVKLLESQVERMKHHMMVSQGLANRQHLEIARLKSEISQLGLFKNIVNKAKQANNHTHHHHHRQHNGYGSEQQQQHSFYSSQPPRRQPHRQLQLQHEEQQQQSRGGAGGQEGEEEVEEEEDGVDDNDDVYDDEDDDDNLVLVSPDMCSVSIDG